MRSRALRLVALVPVALPFLLAPGCYRPETSICNQKCACAPCTDADFDQCVTEVEAIVEAETKCAEQLAKYLTCYDDTLSCQNGTGVGTDQCDSEQKSLEKCSGKGNPFQTACEQASAKIAKCTGSPPPQGQSDCPPASECPSLCVIDTTCDVILGSSFSQEFQNCIGSCSGGVGGAGGKF